MSRDDGSLEHAFDALKSAEAARSPDFALLMARTRARQSRRRRRRAGGVTLLAAAATMVFVSIRSLEREPSGTLAAELISSAGMWRAPTDFLLERGSDPLWRSTETLRETLSYPRRPQ